MLVVIGAVVGAITTAIAYFVPWLPEQASEQRDGIDFIFWLTTAICISIFALVAAVSIYSAYKFRVRPDDDSDGPPIHGHTGIEIAWTAIPAVLVIIIGVASGVVLAQNDRSAAESLRIKVTAQQFAWNFEYPNGVTSGTLRLPIDRDVVLELSARDVIHSFWVPQFGQKQDAVPGIVTKLAITPNRIGEYPVICTELCGLGHSVMRTQAIVMRQGEYDTWLREQGEEMAGPPGQAGAAVFESQGCGSCHTFKPAGSTGKVGPSLDELSASAREAGQPLQEFTRESIVEPNAYIQPGFPRNVMPQTYAQLPEDQLDGLVQYLVGANR
jgi:cytochrome c oxidase subunit II